MKNILVMQLFRFGDMLQTTPAIAALRAAHPESRIYVMARDPFADVLRGNPDVDEIIKWDIRSLHARAEDGAPVVENLSALREFIAPLRARRFDLVCNLSNDMPSALIACLLRPRETAGLLYCGDRQYRVRNDWLRYLFLATEIRCLNTVNVVDIFLEACGGGGSRTPKICVTREDERYAADLLCRHRIPLDGPPIGIQAGASKPFKRWPPDLFAEAATRLGRDGHAILFFGSANERAGVERIIGGMPSCDNVLNLAGRTTFGQLGACLKRCRLLLSNDTATIHVAAAVGTPCLLLTFGPTSGWETGPYGEGHFILEPDVTCFPCKWSERCAHLPCRDLLTIDAVLAAVECATSDGLNVPDTLLGAKVALLRSEFMPDGLLGQRPLNRPPLHLRDVLRAMLRTYYTSRWIGARRKSGAPGWRPWLDEMFSWYRIEDGDALIAQVGHAAKDIATLRDLAKLGVQAANALAVHGRARSCRADATVRLANAVTRLEQRVLASEENDVLRFLVTDFRHALRDMETLPLHETAIAHRWNYWRLAEACSFMEGALREFAVRAVAPSPKPCRVGDSKLVPCGEALSLSKGGP